VPQRRPGGSRDLGAQNPCQLFYRGGFNERSQSQLDSEDLFDLSKELNGQGGVPSQIEVILVEADGWNAEEFFPNAGDLSCCIIPRCGDRGYQCVRQGCVSPFCSLPL